MKLEHTEKSAGGDLTHLLAAIETGGQLNTRLCGAENAVRGNPLCAWRGDRFSRLSRTLHNCLETVYIVLRLRLG
jgi:hypothetical protein